MIRDTWSLVYAMIWHTIWCMIWYEYKRIWFLSSGYRRTFNYTWSQSVLVESFSWCLKMPDLGRLYTKQDPMCVPLPDNNHTESVKSHSQSISVPSSQRDDYSKSATESFSCLFSDFEDTELHARTEGQEPRPVSPRVILTWYLFTAQLIS